MGRTEHAINCMESMFTTRTALAAGMLLSLSACATYHSAPLKDARGAKAISGMSVSAAQMPTVALAHHRFDPADGLDSTEVAMLAVANSPHLRVMRDKLGVSRAQAFAAGLLPDPQLSLSRDVPTSSGNDLSNAFGLGLDYDLGALLTRSARVSGARANQRQVQLDLLWAEWQTVAQARLLFDQVRYQQVLQRRLRHELDAIEPLQEHIQQALNRGDLDYAAANSGLDAAASMRTQLVDASRQLGDAREKLKRLLGLASDAPLHLVGETWNRQPDDAQIERALAQLARRRPDLLALKAGYAAQESAVRAAILGQFPAVQIGVNRARDTSAVFTTGFSIGITLPLFNRNRGNIAIARATRTQLADSYRARLLETRSEVHRLREALRMLDKQQPAIVQHAEQMDTAARAATMHWRNGLLDWPTWLSIRASALAADRDRYDLRQQQATAAIALETLLGGDWSDHTRAAKTLPKTTDPGS